VLKTQVLVAGVLGILIAVLAAGCAAGEPPSKERYVSKLNAMCADFSMKEKEIGEPRTLTDLLGKEPRILEAFDKSILDKVRNLRAPDEIATQADRLVVLAGRQHDVLRELIHAAKEADFAEVGELVSKNEALNKEAKAITHDLGAGACAQGRRPRRRPQARKVGRQHSRATPVPRLSRPAALAHRCNG